MTTIIGSILIVPYHLRLGNLNRFPHKCPICKSPVPHMSHVQILFVECRSWSYSICCTPAISSLSDPVSSLLSRLSQTQYPPCYLIPLRPSILPAISSLSDPVSSLLSRPSQTQYPPCYLVPLGPSILFSNTLNPSPSLNVRDQVSHLHKTTSKIIVLYTLIFIHLTPNLKTRFYTV